MKRNKNGQFIKGIIPVNKTDLSGKRFGNLTVVERIEIKWTEGHTKYLCQCDCGQEKIIDGTKLVNGHTKSCGCLKHRIKDISGRRFGRAIAIKCVGFDKFGVALWLCRCDCGNEFNTSVNRLTTNKCQSCGCLRRDRLRQIAKARREDLTGNQYGAWTVLHRAEKYITPKGSIAGFLWHCICACGTKKKVHSSSLKSGESTSCGCQRKGDKIWNWKGGISFNSKHHRKWHRENLARCYMRSLLRAAGLKSEEITFNFEILKREQVSLYRKFKELKEEMRNVSMDGNV